MRTLRRRLSSLLRSYRRGARERVRKIGLWLSFVRVRESIARRHLRGKGIEIGPLNLPLRTPRRATVTYVDNWTKAELREQYPELADQPIVEPDVIDDGTRLTKFADGSQDFVIANHFLEHCEDTIAALATMLRVTKPGGIVFLTVPDKRRTFDSARPTTPLVHIIRDHEIGPGASRAGHYAEFARLVEGIPEDEVPAYVANALAERPHIHFHVWTHETLVEQLTSLRGRLGFDIVEARSHAHESVVVLQRL
jgi:SAM-dependent methyltransferase